MNPQQSNPGVVQYAGYSQFYASSAPARPPFRPPLVQGQQQYAFQNPHQAYQYVPPPRPPLQVPGPRGTVAAPPRPIPAAVSSGSRWDKIPPSSDPVAISVQKNQWHWNTGKTMPTPAAPSTSKYAPPVTVASAPPRPYTPTTSKFHAQPFPPSKFQDQPTPVSTSSTSPTPAAGQWPSSLKSYVERAFANCRSDADKSIVQSILKEKISAAMTANNLWTKNWDAESLPLNASTSAVAAPQPPHRPMINVRPPPPPAAMTPFPRPPMMPMPQQMPKPHSMPESFIPLDSKKAAKKKASKRKADSDDGFDDDLDGLNKKMQRQQRFLKDSFIANTIRTPSYTGPLQVLNDEGELDLEAMIIKGTCTKIEKDYLRLTSAPHPSAVRPEPILKKALDMVRNKWKEGKCDYLYVVSQMKSIRQDCTVQHIKNDFTVLVYETHARIALEEGDMNEFNQCQTQLRQLYESGIAGNRTEFLAYRILYCIYVCLQGKTDNSGNVGMYRALSMVTSEDRKDSTVQHALAVREAVFANDYQSFFKLYAEPHKMSGYLMDAYVNHMRLQALKIMCKAYQPSIPIDFIKTLLLLEGKEGQAFIKECGIQFVGGNKGPREAVDCKASDIVSVLKSNAKSLL
ncbi:hypothetical protein AC1031_006611 [Aphanomyces cochlioides]|nr:hypothetical protein AC1031_006611 [Aphanomyces cochlioides]